MPPDAARALGRSVGEFDDGLPGLLGSDGRHRGARPGLRRLEEPRLDARPRRATPGPALRAGRARRRPTSTASGDRRATKRASYSRACSWSSSMRRRCRRCHSPRPATPRRRDQRQVALLLGGGRSVVAMAGHAPLVTTDVDRHRSRRSGLHAAVYRRRGYGSAVTAHRDAPLIEKGARVMLFTDAANPTSNAIYQADRLPADRRTRPDALR